MPTIVHPDTYAPESERFPGERQLMKEATFGLSVVTVTRSLILVVTRHVPLNGTKLHYLRDDTVVAIWSEVGYWIRRSVD